MPSRLDGPDPERRPISTGARARLDAALATGARPTSTRPTTAPRRRARADARLAARTRRGGWPAPSHARGAGSRGCRGWWSLSRPAAAVRQLPDAELVVGRRRRRRAAGLGADAPRHHAGGRSGLRIPVRAGVLPAAAAVDQPTGGRHALAGAGDGVRAVSRPVRPARRRGASAARLADLVRVAVGGPGVVEVGLSVRRLSLGVGGLRSGRRSAAAVGPARRRCVAVDGRRAGGMQRDRDRAGNRASGCEAGGTSSGATTPKRSCAAAGRGVAG